MPSTEIANYLCETLRGHRSSDEMRGILHLLDDGESKVAEFDATLRAVAHKIPGLTLDFDKLIAGDPIECDPLISQGNLAILRLDAIYYQAFEAWTKSGASLSSYKSITTPEDPRTYSPRTIKREQSDKNYPPDAEILNQTVNVTLAAFRVQSTITHRRDQLIAQMASGGRKSPEKTCNVGQPAANLENSALSSSPPSFSAPSAPPPETNPDVIDENEIFDLESDQHIKPFPKIGPVKRFGPIKGIDPQIKSPQAQAPSAASGGRKSPEESTQIPHAAPDEVKANPVGSAMRTETSATNKVSLVLREEEPVTPELSVISASPRETSSPTSHFPKEPAYHKRE